MALTATDGSDSTSETQSSFSNKRISISLDDTNFLFWKQHVVLMMRGQGLESFLVESVAPPTKTIPGDGGASIPNSAYLKFVKQDSPITSWLLSIVSPDILPQLVGVETTTSIWSTIVRLYSQLSTTRVMHLHCSLRSIKKASLSMRCHTYTMKIKEICDLLASCGNLVSSIEQIAMILNGFPPEYDPFVASSLPIMNQDAGGSESQSSSRRNDAQYSSTRYKGRPRPQCQSVKSLVILWIDAGIDLTRLLNQLPLSHPDPVQQIRPIHVPSHLTWLKFLMTPCVTTTPNPEMSPATSSLDTIQVNSLMASAFGINGQTWFPDSGATHHVTSEGLTPSISSPYTGKGQVHLGDGSSLDISHIGQATFSTYDRTLHLNDLLHVPHINKKLLSVSKFTRDNSVYFEFHDGYCCIKMKRQVWSFHVGHRLVDFTVSLASLLSIQSKLMQLQLSSMNSQPPSFGFGTSIWNI
ncbi:hypothetical protein GQ457_12G017720 [Hibiscus cannabinus]